MNSSTRFLIKSVFTLRTSEKYWISLRNGVFQIHPVVFKILDFVAKPRISTWAFKKKCNFEQHAVRSAPNVAYAVCVGYIVYGVCGVDLYVACRIDRGVE